ncbi:MULTISPECIES: methyltransferase, FxLD system [unclassified Streptomyces]|uniref:methyltransferase, FxLD system n=1 Tax=unclassified Streptomyces TaxID=2593676 RepID=UPI000823A1C0|nr:methyltransferase, FxLD system [Streptomyces sp. AmelKG-D3]MYU02158.1 methyltransferase, FxLD system [Streptomyces sp. SID8350]SCK61701.1 protein-L-isoaspartate(D-aspartate) O-methyltransferase [Streptomyces sp. AmelKG-D3]
MTTSEVDEVRNQLVQEIKSKVPLTRPVEQALRTVHREIHLPGVGLKEAYLDQAVSIKENPGGPLPLSLASVPSTVAMMLVQLDARDGDHILEIGAGTGYNAALLAELVGLDGSVTTIDIDPGVTLHARDALNKAGYESVTVMERDGLQGVPERGPFTKMIATCGFWDIPTALRAQLEEGGRLVVPLRWRGQTRSVSLTRHGDTLVSEGMELCGFVPIIGQDGERATSLPGDTIRLHHDQDLEGIDAKRLGHAVATPATEVWSHTRIGRQESFDGIWLRATAFEDAACRIEVTAAALKHGVRRPAIPGRSVALVNGDSIAYLILTIDEHETEARQVLLGAAGYGPDGETLAKRLIAHITAWGADPTAVPHMTIHPVDTADADLPEGHVINKDDSRIVLSYA